MKSEEAINVFERAKEKGYERAEKDPALTWKDVEIIIRLYNKAMSYPSVIQWGFGSDIHYQIVLDEFNKQRKK